jgi:hypothetical protein
MTTLRDEFSSVHRIAPASRSNRVATGQSLALIIGIAALMFLTAFSAPTPTAKACHVCDAFLSASQTTPTPTPRQCMPLFSLHRLRSLSSSLNTTLPELQARFGDRLQVTLISWMTNRRSTDCTPRPKSSAWPRCVAIPFMVVGRTVPHRLAGDPGSNAGADRSEGSRGHTLPAPGDFGSRQGCRSIH